MCFWLVGTILLFTFIYTVIWGLATSLIFFALHVYKTVEKRRYNQIVINLATCSSLLLLNQLPTFGWHLNAAGEGKIRYVSLLWALLVYYYWRVIKAVSSRVVNVVITTTSEVCIHRYSDQRCFTMRNMCYVWAQPVYTFLLLSLWPWNFFSILGLAPSQEPPTFRFPLSLLPNFAYLYNW